MRVAQVNESAHLNSMGNLIPPTDRPPVYPGTTIAVGRAVGLDDPTHPHARPRRSAQDTRVLDREVD